MSSIGNSDRESAKITANPAPELTPIRPGDAILLSVTLWRSTPESPSPTPASMPAQVRGKRRVYMIALCAANPSCLKSAEMKLFVSSETLPNRIESKIKATNPAPSERNIKGFLVFTVKILR